MKKYIAKLILINSILLISYNVFADNLNAVVKSTAAPVTKAEITAFRDKMQDLSNGPELIHISADKYIMGSNNKSSASYERPEHQVSIKNSYSISKYPVTFDEYDRFTKATGKPPVNDFNWGRGNRPVINVNIQDAQQFVTWLSQQTGYTYRLPSEAEWEYAARAGSTSNYPWGDNMKVGMANCSLCGSQWDRKMTSPVGQFPANAWGLHDMLGNVWELTADCWNFTYDGAPTDGSAWRSGDCKRTVLRGGSWGDHPKDLRSSTRLRSYSGTRTIVIGFRVVREDTDSSERVKIASH